MKAIEMTKENGLVNTREAAALLGCSRQRVHQLIQAGRLYCVELDGHVMILRQSLIWHIALMRLGSLRSQILRLVEQLPATPGTRADEWLASVAREDE